MNNVIVKNEWCKKCGICIEFCPTQVFISEEDGTPIPKYLDKCTGCNLCALRCPDFAITVEVEKNGIK